MNTSKNGFFFNKVIPVEYYRKAILSTILKFQVTIVQAETGSGKTIFIPKILYLSGFKKIIISLKLYMFKVFKILRKFCLSV